MPASVDVSIRIPSTDPLPQVVEVIKRVEAAGFDGVGLLDSQLLCRDTFVTLTLAAGQTSRLRLFPAVTNPFGRHDSVLAGAMVSLAELAPGRVACIIGTGYTAAITIGRKPASLARMRECLGRVRTLVSGGSADFDGTPGRLQFCRGERIPVLMSASGPRAIELAAEVADGVLLLVGYSPEIVAAAFEHLEIGARRGGRRLEDLEIVWAVRTATAASTEEARRQARPTAVHWGMLRQKNYWLERSGLELPDLEVPQAIWDIYPDLSHALDWEAAIAATDYVPDEVIARLCDALGLIGTAEHCAERVMELAGAGATSLYLMPLQTFIPPEPEIAAFRDVIFPRLRAAGYR